MSSPVNNESSLRKSSYGGKDESLVRSISLPAGRVNYICRGQGTPVVMLHGLAASLHDWDFLIPILENTGHTACALDLLGHGESAKPSRLDEYTCDRVFDHLVDGIEILHRVEPKILIGHSLGGYFSLLYALRFPESVRALILVNPFYSLRQLSQFLRLVFRRPLINTLLIERTPYWMFRFLIDITSFNLGRRSDGHHELTEKVRIQTALDFKRAAPGIYNIPRSMRDITPDLMNVTVPVLVIWGLRDHTLFRDSFPILVDALPNAKVEVIRTCGHVPHQCHPQDFNQRVLNFLRQIEPGSEGSG